MNDKLWIALFLFATFADEKDFEILTSDSFDFDYVYDRIVQCTEDTDSESIKRSFIEFMKSQKEKFRDLNEVCRQAKSKAEGMVDDNT